MNSLPPVCLASQIASVAREIGGRADKEGNEFSPRCATELPRVESPADLENAM
jgi:hypothetical protein